jgi:hypothetical protein
VRSDDGSYWYPMAIAPLLATRKERALRLACGILRKPRFEVGGFNGGAVVHRLFLAGRRESLTYLLKELDSTRDAGTMSTTRKGKEITVKLIGADRAAEVVAGWRTDGFSYDAAAPAAVKLRRRTELKRWLGQQLALIRRGQRPAMKTKAGRLLPGEWVLDAP